VINPSVCLSVREHISGTAGPTFTNFLCGSRVVVVRSSSRGVALRYVLPVLWMTSRFAVMGATTKREGCTVSDGHERRYWGGFWCLWMLVNY